MKILTKIKKKLGLKTQPTLSQDIQKRWVYKLSLEQVSLVFEAHDLSCFGFFKNTNYRDFISEYNELFNSGSGKKQFNSERFSLTLYLKHQKLRAMYDALTVCDAENSRKEFKAMFGKEYESTDDLKLITNLAEQINQKLEALNPKESDKSTKEGISFNKLVTIVELSRGINIDRKIKLYEFYGMYETELEKWNNGRHK
jgi:aldehyde:ferredoxin oxidoreductase